MSNYSEEHKEFLKKKKKEKIIVISFQILILLVFILGWELLARFNGNLITTLRYYNSGHDYNEKGEQYAENIKKEYEELVSLYVRDEESHGVIYRKEHF